jgi:hypothetical protein
VPGERARGYEPRLGGSVSPDHQLESRPRRDGADLEVPPARHRLRRRQPDAPARGLGEADPTVSDLGLGLDHGELDRRERDLVSLELRACAQHVTTGLPIVDDLVALDLDPRVQLVGLAKGVAPPQLVEVGDEVRRRLVVVRDRKLERYGG